MSAPIRVITTCTSRKVASVPAPDHYALPGLQRDHGRVPAEDLYTGEQHRRLMAGVRAAEAVRPVELWVISAKAGLIAGKHELAPYDESFAGMPTEALRTLAKQLGIPRDVRALAACPAELTMMLIGNDYFDAAALDEPVEWASPTLVLSSPSRSESLPAHPNLVPVPISQALAKRWSLPLTLLKGEIAGRMLTALAAEAVTPTGLIADEATRKQLLQPVAC